MWSAWRGQRYDRGAGRLLPSGRGKAAGPVRPRMLSLLDTACNLGMPAGGGFSERDRENTQESRNLTYTAVTYDLSINFFKKHKSTNCLRQNF